MELENERIQKEQRATEERKKKEEAASLGKFRSSIKAGDDTSCGPIIEIKKPMVRIALRSEYKGNASDIWLKNSEVFPMGYQCPQGITGSGQEKATTATTPSQDNKGRKIIRGPVGDGVYNNVHIISNTVGVDGSFVSVTNSVIEAPVCIRISGQNSLVSNNDLICRLCVEFTSGALIGHTLTNNRCDGQGTNRSDVFGW